MKTSHFFFILLAVLLFSCGQQKENDQFGEFSYGSNDNYNDYESQGGFDRNNQQKRNSNNRDIKYHNLMDPQFGIPCGAMPIPTSWRESNNTKENLMFEGPNKLKVYKAMSFNDLDGQIKNLSQFIDQDLRSLANAEGFRYVKQYPLPQMVQFDKKLSSYEYSAIPLQKQHQCIATEWENQAGISSVVIVRYYAVQYQNGISGWGITLNCLEASKSYFEEAKNNYINAILNFQINPQWVQVSNQYWKQQAQQATAGHKQRMAAIESFGRNNTAKHNARMAASDAQFNNWRAGQAASDAQYNSWRAGQALSDAGQSNYVDGIWEQRNMTDPNTGQQYQVDGYDNNVWMNQNNEYIGTDNTLYNPNLDNNVNNQNWIELEDDNN